MAGVRCPAISTVHAVLDRYGLVTRRAGPVDPREPVRRSVARPAQSALVCRLQGRVHARRSPVLLPADDHGFCQSVSVPCEALSTTQERYAFTVFERVFKDFGLPAAIRTDNGVPFASPNALYGLSRLSVWWLRLGIRIERIKPGHPEQNGRHERMHLTLKTEATKPGGRNFLQQQARFDAFSSATTTSGRTKPWRCACPHELYTPSPRPYRGLPDLVYPYHDWTAVVTHCGRLCFDRRKVNLSQVFAGQQVGVRRYGPHLARELYGLRLGILRR